MRITTRLGREVDVAEDYTVDQNWAHFSAEEHARWDRLYARQMEVLPGRAVPAFFDGLDSLKLSDGGIPDFEELSERLMARTGWRVVAVPDLVPDAVFFDHLANRRFPAGNFIRSEAQFDYIQEPDVFHDVFGHVPLLADPVFADYLEAYGKGGLAAAGRGVLANLARLYWYTVEFGLIQTAEGLRIYGAGIVSSPAESVFALESDSPNRLHFDLERVMQTDYRIDDFQQTYWVIDSFEELLGATYQPFGPIYDRLEGCTDAYRPAQVIEGDTVYTYGSQAHASEQAARV
ncbi:phenylalanine 4-monooxygenase [Rhodothalassium salexigens]|uniref:phenylalanine 4-monooxygenase n=1 Tax=Rhodothalassium salexigens TaxID=1086 RepID=UPI001912B3F4|nr:phenylalanine 4-monooxygenase [Rhodothalassium salexigens]MBK5910751.1 phenylalanine 4-monooxygenase [Rhodothalassium salexigens]MBK5919799.1 phenylalanine 4-monooxygenase [Rhodothalassium salexigens]